MNKLVISDVVKIREEILKKKEIEGIIYTYNLLKKGDYIEKLSDWVFDHTYPSIPLNIFYCCRGFCCNFICDTHNFRNFSGNSP